jgi:diacylglycerol kinase
LSDGFCQDDDMATPFLGPAQATLADEGEAGLGARPRLSWRGRLRHALGGIKRGVRGTSSFFVHFFFAAMILATAIVLHCDLLEWCILLGSIAAVLVVELFHGAVETVVRSLEDGAANRAKAALAISSGAVLVARLTTALIAGMIVLSRLLAFLPRCGEV